MSKQIQDYINFLIICLTISNICFTQIDGCTDPDAYNCADDVLIDGNEYPNYIFEIGGILYANSCNYILNDFSEVIYQGGCENDPCVGYYDPNADTDDGSCRYYQAPHNEDVIFSQEENGINIDWSAFSPPVNATLVSYHIQRCVESCTWIDGFTLGDENTQTLVFDNYSYEFDVEIKYAIAVKYSNNPYWGWAIGASYITPVCPSLGDINGDSSWNVQDIVILAGCVLLTSCSDHANACAADMTGDGGYNVLDIVTLANCVLSQTCGS